MFQKIEHKIAAAFIGLASLLGYQYHRPATLEHNPSPEQVQSVKVPQVQPIPLPTPALSGVPQVTLGNIAGATDLEAEQIKKGIDEDNQVLASDCFKQQVLNFDFTERNLNDSDVQLSNEQIWAELTKNVLVVNVKVYTGTRWENYVSKTMGYEIGDGVTYANRFYIDTPELFGSLDLHEGAHLVGWHHYLVFETSIPYKFNDFFDLCLGKK